MSEMLVIVESPAKAKTIGKFLGSKYKIVASNGHVRALPKSQLGVDVEHDFEPKYITLRGRGEVLDNIRREAKAAKKIYLATDPDMEGEAISWHLAHILKMDANSPCRIVFNEITSNTVKKSVKEPRAINMDLVDAQQARQAGGLQDKSDTLGKGAQRPFRRPRAVGGCKHHLRQGTGNKRLRSGGILEYHRQAQGTGQPQAA